MEPDAGLQLMTQTEIKNQELNGLSHSGAPFKFLIFFLNVADILENNYSFPRIIYIEFPGSSVVLSIIRYVYSFLSGVTILIYAMFTFIINLAHCFRERNALFQS